MRHKNGIKKLGKPTDQRLAMIRSIVRALLLNNRVKTTVPRAKEAKKLAEKLITLGKKGDLSARRKAISLLHDKEIVKDIFLGYGKKYQSRSGGYTRIIPLGFRRGDAAKIALLEFVE